MSYVNGIKQYVTFRVRLLSLNIMFLKFIHIVAYISTSFSWLENIPPSVYNTICLSIHVSMDLWTGPFTARKEIFANLEIRRQGLMDREQRSIWGYLSAHFTRSLGLSSAWGYK